MTIASSAFDRYAAQAPMRPRNLRTVKLLVLCTLEELGGWKLVHLDLGATELAAL